VSISLNMSMGLLGVGSTDDFGCLECATRLGTLEGAGVVVAGIISWIFREADERWHTGLGICHLRGVRTW